MTKKKQVLSMISIALMSLLIVTMLNVANMANARLLMGEGESLWDRGRTRHGGKIHFIMSPNPYATFNPPPGVEADAIIVWVSVVKDSTYGRFTLAMVGYENHTDPNRNEYHYYTDYFMAGRMYAYLDARLFPEMQNYDVSVARIYVTESALQLNATVIVRDQMLFKVTYWVDISSPVESRIELTSLSTELYLSVEAYRPILDASVTGLNVGDFIDGRFDYIDTELVDSSLLP